MTSTNEWFERWPDGLISIDAQHNIVALSPAAEKILGWSSDSAKQHNIHELLCAQNRAFAHEASHCHLLDEHHHNDIVSALWKNNTGKYVSVDCRILPIESDDASKLVSFVNNEDRLHNQAEMHKFAEYVGKSPAPLAEFDQYGQLLFGNESLQNLIVLYGFNDIGHANIFPAELNELCNELIQNNTKEKSVVVNIDAACFAWHFNLLQTEAETSVMGYAFDITEQKKAEKIAEEQRALARKEFYAKMIHELRTPLNAIIGFSDILLTRSADKLDERELRHVTMIKTAGNQLNQLVTDTLDITKIESGKMKIDVNEFSINHVCEEILGQVKTLADQKGLSFRFNTMTERKIFSDKTKVRQIILNLLSNAVKYTKEGSVHLLVSDKTHEELGNCLSVTVTDTGIGIPKNQLPNVFVSFEQINEKQNKNEQGTGLGLALVSNLVDLLGGRISAESEYGAGSTFELLLPCFFQNQE